MSKIQIFESNSQQSHVTKVQQYYCLRCQRYKFLKAIHNFNFLQIIWQKIVYDVKDTNFESNSQQPFVFLIPHQHCLRCQRYKF